MGLISALTGGVAGAVSTGVSAYFKHADEKLSSDELMQRIKEAPGLLQGEIDKAEAASPNTFVHWRDFIGWVCGVALAWQYIAQPMLAFGIAAFSILPANTVLPSLDTQPLFTLMLGMLGLGGMHVFERVKGVVR